MVGTMASTAHHKGEGPVGGKTRQALQVFGKTASAILSLLATLRKGGKHGS